ncbi:uncharacterized protein BO95DRAFT_510276 [Aspergillus brunneoviolaceus CBS 621.78]|uniref:Uncharacterized protein n=1 Tax=Aspergillus brunneoviolaceus CBS 621.78 TaxID=1450534 RepID=A0ACD1GPT0_9EURO|nr:hypothetical protein BO95DRAFT_510276 [Aspergillus brunneoviolaceus CBS 621.78]RAH51261.1 hypothetical protein BO95DRAFT_510276 [Aspergillus brunneoviolaceus CBS 621.78]
MWNFLEARDAASKAAYNTNVQLWTMYAIGVAVTMLRTWSQARVVGWRHLRLDDYLVWVGILFYTAQVSLAYNVGAVAHGLANNSMTDAQRATLSPESPEYHARVIGSKIQLAGWATYSALISFLKLSMLAFYTRLMNGLGRQYRIPIYIGFVLVVGSFLASIITVLASCRPFHKNWQIYPDPGNVCQPAISMPVVAITFASNLLTDPYLILLPIPMLWGSSLKVIKKIAATVILSAGIFILVCATLKAVFIIVEQDNGASLAEEWGTRETFAAVITTNLPMVFHLLRTWLARAFGSAFQSSQKSYKSPSGFQTIGGGGGGPGGSSSRNRGKASDPITIGLTFTESEERMMDDVKMQALKAYPAPVSPHPGADSGAIVVSNQIEITHETRSSAHSDVEAAGRTTPHAPGESWLR